MRRLAIASALLYACSTVQAEKAGDGAGGDAGTSFEAGPGGDAATASERVVPLGLGARHSCAISPSGAVRCWGGNDNGQLGIGSHVDKGKQPGEIAALAAIDLGPSATVVQVVAGDRHTCALLSSGKVKCWGSGGDGQLGNDSATERGDEPTDMGAALPEVILGAGRTAVQIASGSTHACARLDDGTARCWGRNTSGQLGLGDSQTRGNSAGEMATLHAIDFGAGRTVKQIACGELFTCARLDDGSVKCFGNNQFGQLGVGDTAAHGNRPNDMGANLAAVSLGAGRTATDIALGATHACAKLDTGSVKCWGRNDLGQLGLGDTENRGTMATQMGEALPALDFGAGRTVASLRLGEKFGCAVLDNGAIKCFGGATDGQLGSGATMARGDGAGEMGDMLANVDLGSGRTVLGHAAGTGHVCAELDDRTIKCWGLNVSGELGLGDINRRGDAPGEMGAMLPVVPLP